MKTLSLILLLATAAFAGDQSVTLEWNRNPETNVAAYVIYYGTAPRGYTQATNVGNITRGTVRGLDAGTNWFFAVTAVNTSGLESEFSNEVTTRIPEKPQSPVITTNWWNVPPMRTVIYQMPVSL